MRIYEKKYAERCLLILSALPIILGLVVITGWYLGNISLTQIKPGFASMKYNTALCFVMTGAGVIFAVLKLPKVTFLLGSCVLLISGLTALEYILNKDFGLDNLFVTPDPSTQVRTLFIGRMSPNTTFNFFISGISLLGISFYNENRRWPLLIATAFGLVVSAVGLMSAVVYTFDAEYTNMWGSNLIRVALHTSIGFTITGLALYLFSFINAENKRKILGFGLIAFTITIASYINMFFPSGIAVGIAYVALIFCSTLLDYHFIEFTLAIIATLLICASHLIMKTGGEIDFVVAVNRLMSISVIWISAFLLYHVKKQNLVVFSSAERIRAILDNTVDGIITINEGGIIQSFNLACEKIFQYKANEVIGKNVKILMPEPYRREHDGYLSNYHKTGKAKIIGIGREVECRRKDGTIFPADLSIGKVSLKNGRMFTGLIRDISERKAAKKSLEDMNNKLLRTNEELESFTYIASHDLQGPLVNLKGFSSELETSINSIMPIISESAETLDTHKKAAVDDIVKNDIPRALHFISGSVDKMERLTNAILELSRIGRRKMVFETIDTNKMVRNCIVPFQHQLDKQNIKVSIGQLPDVVADYLSLNQIFSNIIDNSIKYMKPSGGNIDISCDNGGELQIFRIEDTGKGISAENIPKVFEIFRRFDDSDIKGEGMGMAYVKSLVEKHGGNIWCESAPNKGTIFYFTIGENLKEGGSDE